MSGCPNLTSDRTQTLDSCTFHTCHSPHSTSLPLQHSLYMKCFIQWKKRDAGKKDVLKFMSMHKNPFNYISWLFDKLLWGSIVRQCVCVSKRQTSFSSITSVHIWVMPQNYGCRLSELRYIFLLKKKKEKWWSKENIESQSFSGSFGWKSSAASQQAEFGDKERMEGPKTASALQLIPTYSQAVS